MQSCLGATTNKIGSAETLFAAIANMSGVPDFEEGNNQHDDDAPPFAIEEKNVPQHLLVNQPEGGLLTPSPPPIPTLQKKSLNSQTSSTSSPPPGLMESMMSTPTEGSNSSELAPCSTSDSAGMFPSNLDAASKYLDSSSTFLFSSLPTVGSVAGGASSHHLPHSHGFEQHGIPANVSKPHHGEDSLNGASRGSVGFSQLMQAADDENYGLGKSTRMPVVLEEGMATTPPSNEASLYSSVGTLISAGAVPEDVPCSDAQPGSSPWFHNLLCLDTSPMDMVCSPLLGPASPSAASAMAAPLLSYSPTSMEIERTRARIKSSLIDDESFEVSMELGTRFNPRHVMDVLGNPEFLRLWCEPIQALVITNSSEGANDSTNSGQPIAGQDREYEGEWIEATTGSLVSPPGNGTYLHGAVQVILNTLGFASYGKVTMFVERRRGHVGLTVGPFHGGIYASHTIMVHEEEGGVVRVVDRVRLNKEENELLLAGMFFCGVFDSLNRCLLPSLGSYMEQVTKSLIQLRGLVERREAQERNLIEHSQHRIWPTHEAGIMVNA